MLDETLIGSGDRSACRRKWLLMPISLLAHVLAIAALVIVPLLLAESQLPQINVTNILIMAPPRPTPPPPPPPPLGRRKGAGGVKNSATRNMEKPPVYAGKFVAPIEVPVTIGEDEGSDFGVEGGVPWGVSGGVEGGVEGGVVGGVLGGVLGGTLPDEQPVFVSGKNVPKLVKQVKPEYPQEAFAARIQAMVIVEARTDIYGRVRQARIISGHPVFNEAALAAVRQWLYEPYIVDGIPRPIYFTVSMTFGFIPQYNQSYPYFLIRNWQAILLLFSLPIPLQTGVFTIGDLCPESLSKQYNAKGAQYVMDSFRRYEVVPDHGIIKTGKLLPVPTHAV